MNTENNGETSDVEVRSENLEPPSWIDSVSSFATNVLKKLTMDNWEVSILLTDTAAIQELNRTYRGIDSATDVLSFCESDSDEAESYAITTVRHTGDIVLALPYIEKQADRFSVSYEEEIRRMIVHGLLHLAGHTHSTNDFQTEPMLITQEEILKETKEKLF